MNKKIYCTLDTETVSGASQNEGIYHLGGLIHDRKGNVLASFNYLIAENFDKIDQAFYGKKNFGIYQEMIANGVCSIIPTERQAVDLVKTILDYYGVSTMCAYNSAFDYSKTLCRELVEDREFIDLWLMALQTIATKKSFIRFCENNNFITKKKSCKTSAEVVYRFLTNNTEFEEEHTAFEDSKIEMQIFLECLKMHKGFTRNTHCFDFPNSWSLFTTVA